MPKRRKTNLDVPRIRVYSASEQDITPDDLITELSPMNPGNVEMDPTLDKGRIMRSAWGVNLAFFFVWTAVSGLAIIQSSIIGVVGTVGLGLNFAASIVGCTVLAPIAMRVLGCKVSMMIGIGCVLLWEAANLYPTYWTVIPGAIASGAAMGPMFAGQGTYLTEQGTRYAQLVGEDSEAAIGRFFGFYFCLFLSSVSIGSLVTSSILSADFGSKPSNASHLNASTQPKGPMAHCGAGFCPGNNISTEAEEDYNQINLYVLVSTHMAITVIGALFMGLMVDRLPAKGSLNEETSAWYEAKKSVALILRQCKKKQQMLLSVSNIYIGMMQTFVMADLTNGFIACAIGVDSTGYALVTYGFVACAVSFLCGILLEHTGRIPLFSFANLMRLAVTVSLLVWVPDPSQKWVFYLVPALWAVGDSMLISLTNSLYGVIFEDNTEGAFATYRFLESIGFVIGYMYNTAFCVSVKIYILITVHLIGSIFYYVAEYSIKKSQSNVSLKT